MTNDVDLTAHNTLGLMAQADAVMPLAYLPDLVFALDHAADTGMSFHVIGGGSNVVLAPKVRGIVGLVRMMGKRIDTSDPEAVRIIVGAGESWPDLVDWTVAQGYGGLENLAGIPGTVGAAPIQNIGAYGREVSDVFESLTALDTRTRRPVEFAREDCGFSYRHSRFKDEPGRYIVLQVTLRLPLPWQPITTYAGLEDLTDARDPAALRDRVLELRASKLPDWRVTGNAGSFFVNPVVPDTPRFADLPGYPVPGGRKLSAAALIEAVGLKGYRIGGAGFSEKHALVLINHGGATHSDVTALAEVAKTRVRAQFGVDIVQEPVVIG